MSVVTQLTNKEQTNQSEQAGQQRIARRLAWFFALWLVSVFALAALVWPLRWIFSSLISP